MMGTSHPVRPAIVPKAPAESLLFDRPVRTVRFESASSAESLRGAPKSARYRGFSFRLARRERQDLVISDFPPLAHERGYRLSCHLTETSLRIFMAGDSSGRQGLYESLVPGQLEGRRRELEPSFIHYILFLLSWR